jgi:hypothetical protein
MSVTWQTSLMGISSAAAPGTPGVAFAGVADITGAGDINKVNTASMLRIHLADLRFILPLL